MRGRRSRVNGLVGGFNRVNAGSTPRDVPDEVVALRALHQVTQRVHASLDLAETLDAVARGVLEATSFSVVTISLRRPSGDFEVVCVEGSDSARGKLLGQLKQDGEWLRMLERSEHWGALRFSDHRLLTAEDDAIVSASWIPDIPVVDEPNAWHPMDALFAPLVAPTGLVVGTLSVDVPRDGRRPSRAQCEVLELFADHAAVAIEHARMTVALQGNRDEMSHAAQHDPLTGLANRALLMDRGVEAVAGGADFGVLVLDLDGFKAVNDTAGHRAGDEVLQLLAARMRACARAEDLVARVGGDEFAVIVPLPDGVGLEVLEALADRLRRVCVEPVMTDFGRHRVGVSVGTAVAPAGATFDDVLAAADAAMFIEKRAKGSGHG